MRQDSNRDTSPSTSMSRMTNKPATKATSDELGKTKDALIEGAHQLTDEMKTAVGDAADQARMVAETKLDAGRDFAAEHLGSVAQALRKTGDELGKSDSALTGYVDQAASTVEDVAHYLQTRTLSQLMGDLESFARREPAMFLGGSFVAGIMGGRFLKSATPAQSTSGTSRTPSANQATSPTQRPALPAYASPRASVTSNAQPMLGTQWVNHKSATEMATSSATGTPHGTSEKPAVNAGSGNAGDTSTPKAASAERGTAPSGTPGDGRPYSPTARGNGTNGSAQKAPNAGPR
jgi:hypothetical protein